jgi:transcriptional regulator with XRE-family HTH domain
MAAQRLDNYLKTYRKRSGLSQAELAFLLGCQSGTKVSRYERQARVPTLETALAFGAIFGAPLRELFAGKCHKVESEIRKRARMLTEKLGKTGSDRSTARKLEMLRTLAGLPAQTHDGDPNK